MVINHFLDKVKTLSFRYSPDQEQMDAMINENRFLRFVNIMQTLYRINKFKTLHSGINHS